MTNIVIASSKDWFRNHPKSFEYKALDTIDISKKEELNLDLLEEVNPRYIFFPHWSWKVEPEIIDRYECVAFHTAPLPYGRGGSPIQNLIIRGFKKSPVCALRMNNTLDAGPIYDFMDVPLDGTISDIFSKIATNVEDMIIRICRDNPIPVEQSGEVVLFNRLTCNDNELKSENSIIELYDRIRMVDGHGYSRAYINFGNYKIYLSDAHLDNNQLTAQVTITL